MINEVSTVAAAYAMAGFATDATHVSNSGTALAQTGIANAFANAANLETLSTGVALSTTPAGNGTVPQTEINTLGNILASCVNTNGEGSTACTTLFTNALAGGTTGTLPAAINIAHNPATNVASLYALAGGTPPFASALTAVPNDWTVALNFTGGFNNPTGIAIDSSGDAWVVSTATVSTKSLASVVELSSSGVVLSGAGGFAQGVMIEGDGVAIDGLANVWLLSVGSPFAYEISSTGAFVATPYGHYGGAATRGLRSTAQETRGLRAAICSPRYQDPQVLESPFPIPASSTMESRHPMVRPSLLTARVVRG